MSAVANDALRPWDHATELAVAGYPVFPCGPNKQPLTTHGFKDATTDLDVIQEWCDRYPDALIAVPTGGASGLVVVDIDPDGAQWYAERAADLACGRVHHTRRGHHLLYGVPHVEIRNSASQVTDGVDVRGEGGYAVWWPAHGLHAIGELDDIGCMPQWLIDVIRKPSPKSSSITVPPMAGSIPEKRRNEFLSREAFRMRKQGASIEQITEALLTINRTRCNPPLEEEEVRKIAAGKRTIEPQPTTITVGDFYAYMPMHQYIFTPSRELWPGSSVNSRVEPIIVGDKPVKASDWLDMHQPVDQMTWAPGMPMVIRDRLISNGGWIDRSGCACFNLYLPPPVEVGNPDDAGRWIDHVHRVFGDDSEHLIRWLAHRVQHPEQKINHAIVLGGGQGIGKDTLLEPVKYAVGPWNFSEVSPQNLLGRFNGFVKSVILRVSEARDLGDIDRYAFYDHMKVYTAAPPDVLRCDEKNIREYSVLNVCGVVITTNHKTDGIYLPADDRRHFVAWSDLTRDAFTGDYWNDLWRWYGAGGLQNVAAYLATLDLSAFDPKAPPPKTAAFWDIVDANRAPEDAELADALDAHGNPAAITISAISTLATGPFKEWLLDRRNRRQIPHRMEEAGYVPVRNDGAKDGLWIVEGKRQAIYAKRDLALRDRVAAARGLSRWNQ